MAELLIQYADQTVNGKRAVVRNGYLPERSIQTGLGEVPVKVPKVRDRSGGGIKFNSKLVPPYLKRTKNVEEFIPWLYLKGISTGEMQPALEALLLLCHIMSCVRGAMWLSLTHCFIKVFYDDLAKFPLPPWKRPFSGSQITSTLILSHFRNFCHLAPTASVAHSTAISVDYSRHLVGACYA